MWLEGWGGGLALLQVAEVHARLGETKPKLTNVCKEIKGQKGVGGGFTLGLLREMAIARVQ